EILQRRELQAVGTEHGNQPGEVVVGPQAIASRVAVSGTGGLAGKVAALGGERGVVDEVRDHVGRAELSGKAGAILVEVITGKRQPDPHPPSSLPRAGTCR